VQAFLDARVGLLDEFLNVTALGPDGRLLATLRPSATGKPFSALGKQYFDETLAKKRAIVSAPLRNVLSGAPIVLVTAPLYDEQGKLVLMLAGGIELQRTAFLRQIDLLKPGKTGFVFIMTGAGILVDHPDRTRLMQHIHQRPGINNATKMAGRSLAEVFGAEACVLAKPHLEAAFDGQAVTYESRTALAGRARILETTYVPDMQADGNVAGVYALAHDTTRMKEVEEKLIQLTRVDSLTGIANRRMFVEALHLAIERARRSGAPMALAYLDIDHFKAINDTHGHALGDDALKEFAPRLSVDVRATDTVARLSGDEFVIIFEDLNSEQEVTAAAAKIIDAVRAPFAAGDVRLAVTASVGIALFRGQGQSHEELLANADSALYTAKRNGRDGVSVHGWWPCAFAEVAAHRAFHGEPALTARLGRSLALRPCPSGWSVLAGAPRRSCRCGSSRRTDAAAAR
jgi:diguanylate cyclase (GGDEF)-like protein